MVGFRILMMVVVSIIVGACVSDADRHAQDVATCQSIGFQAGTSEMRDCLLRLAVARRTHTHYR
jgi:hypothetical protein